MHQDSVGEFQKGNRKKGHLLFQTHRNQLRDPQENRLYWRKEKQKEKSNPAHDHRAGKEKHPPYGQRAPPFGSGFVKKWKRWFVLRTPIQGWKVPINWKIVERQVNQYQNWGGELKNVVWTALPKKINKISKDSEKETEMVRWENCAKMFTKKEI